MLEKLWPDLLWNFNRSLNFVATISLARARLGYDAALEDMFYADHLACGVNGTKLQREDC